MSRGDSGGETYEEVLERVRRQELGLLSESGLTGNWWSAKGIRIICPACQDHEHDACYGPDFSCECWERDHFGLHRAWLEMSDDEYVAEVNRVVAS